MNAPIAIGANRVRIRMSRRVVICMGLGGGGGFAYRVVISNLKDDPPPHQLPF
jgi:hypothetical protein